MKVLVTGAAGFIGSNICEKLVMHGHDVVGLDNYLLGVKKNLSTVIDKMSMVEGSITDEQLIKDLTKDVDVICNQAAISNASMFVPDKIRESVAVNVDGFLTLLKVAVENKVKRVVYASTSSVYGNIQLPLREDMNVVPPNFYASTKLQNEHSALLFSQMYGLETIGLRYTSVYGRHEESKGVYANLVSQFLWAMQKGEQPVIYGDGKQTRDFVYADDIARANVMAIESKKEHIGDILNVGTGKCYSQNETIEMLNDLLGRNITAKYIDTPVKNYVSNQMADISKIGHFLDWTPEFNLVKGTKNLINYLFG